MLTIIDVDYLIYTTVYTLLLPGPRIALKYGHSLDNVYLADEYNGIIDYMHPEGMWSN